MSALLLTGRRFILLPLGAEDGLGGHSGCDGVRLSLVLFLLLSKKKGLLRVRRQAAYLAFVLPAQDRTRERDREGLSRAMDEGSTTAERSRRTAAGRATRVKKNETAGRVGNYHYSTMI